MDNKYICRLCRRTFTEEEMSKEHYPAKSVGNDDIVALDIIKLFDSFQSGRALNELKEEMKNGKSLDEAMGDYFDNKLSYSLYPKGRSAITLCRKCNSFLGEYDESYLKFFNCDGAPKIVKGFQPNTKLAIIKAIYGKFLSVPEAENEEFDFLDFIRDKSDVSYRGKWRLYFVHRDLSSDILGMKDIGTGKVEYDKGVVYELSDEKFIFNLMNFEKHDCFKMNNIIDIMNKEYKLIYGVGENGGYHAQILISRMLRCD